MYNKYQVGSKTQISRLESVVHDAEGTRIQVSVPNKIVGMFARKVKEGEVYQIKNFMVKRNVGKFRVTNHIFKIELTMKTMISDLMQPTFPKAIFSFKPFEEIKAMQTAAEEPLFDVIGVIVGKGFVKNDTDAKMVELKLEDENCNQIYCTLWEDYVDMFLNLVDEGEMRVCSSNNASKVYLHADIEEIESFRKKS
ncbi:uncharacterized protein LOC130994284 [Salvia miltiorrhiza]|uniref:uncharacterized protein LOC130994284 n=1 Tax=Salvia miltiorrhiza TaxID=226208 RepID=UPI0025AC76C7|nr:uncharacterized protein LOC130994284 [Salvia miltiorrhiza]